MDQSEGNNDKAKATKQGDNNPQPPTTCKKNNKITDCNEDKSHQKQKIAWPSRLQAFCTLAIVFITGFYTYYAREQVGQMKEAVRITGDQFRLDQRAWMGITIMSGQFEVGKPMTITINFQNTGKTPAKEITNVMVVEPLEGNAAPDFTREQIAFKEGKGLATPQQKIHSSMKAPEEKPLTDVGFKNVINGKVRIYIHGILEYDDIFGHHHWITYCHYLATDGENFNAYKEHNDTDNN